MITGPNLSQQNAVIKQLETYSETLAALFSLSMTLEPSFTSKHVLMSPKCSLSTQGKVIGPKTRFKPTEKSHVDTGTIGW